MSDSKISDLQRAKRGVALLGACIVQTMNESDPTFERRFLDRLERVYRDLKDGELYDGNITEEMELLSWTRENLTGFSHFRGQEDPLLHDYQPKK